MQSFAYISFHISFQVESERIRLLCFYCFKNAATSSQLYSVHFFGHCYICNTITHHVEGDISQFIFFDWIVELLTERLFVFFSFLKHMTASTCRLGIFKEICIYLCILCFLNNIKIFWMKKKIKTRWYCIFG